MVAVAGVSCAGRVGDQGFGKGALAGIFPVLSVVPEKKNMHINIYTI